MPQQSADQETQKTSTLIKGVGSQAWSPYVLVCFLRYVDLSSHFITTLTALLFCSHDTLRFPYMEVTGLHSLLQSSVEAGFKIQKERRIASQLLYFFCWSPFLFRLRVCSFWKSIKHLQLADSLLVISAGLYCITFFEVSSWEEWIGLAQRICRR